MSDIVFFGKAFGCTVESIFILCLDNFLAPLVSGPVLIWKLYGSSWLMAHVRSGVRHAEYVPVDSSDLSAALDTICIILARVTYPNR